MNCSNPKLRFREKLQFALRDFTWPTYSLNMSGEDLCYLHPPALMAPSPHLHPIAGTNWEPATEFVIDALLTQKFQNNQENLPFKETMQT